MFDVRSYPVLARTALVPRSRRSGGRDGFLNVPRSRPGTALVFQAGGRFVAALPGETPDPGRYPPGATAAMIVSLQREIVTVTVTMPSSRKGVHFGMEAIFECRVTDAGLLLHFGCWEAAPWLRRYLDDDPAARVLAAGTDPADLGPLAARLTARAGMRGRISPPFVPGMTCELLQSVIDVRLPPDPSVPPDPPHAPSAKPPPSRPAGPAPQDYVWDE